MRLFIPQLLAQNFVREVVHLPVMWICKLMVTLAFHTLLKVKVKTKNYDMTNFLVIGFSRQLKVLTHNSLHDSHDDCLSSIPAPFRPTLVENLRWARTREQGADVLAIASKWVDWWAMTSRVSSCRLPQKNNNKLCSPAAGATAPTTRLPRSRHFPYKTS